MKNILFTSTLALASLFAGTVIPQTASAAPSDETPNATVERLIAALNQSDLEAAAALYEDNAIFVVEPGRTVVGRAAIKEALGAMLALKPRLSTAKYEIVQTGDTALYISDWSMTGTTPDGHPVNLGGLSADVLRKQPDGSWLVAVDNPHGSKILASPAATHP